MKTLLAALFFACCAAPALAKEPLESEDKEKSRAEHRQREEQKTKVDASDSTPRAQTLGRDQSGVYVNAPAANSAYSPSFVMRGFPALLSGLE